MARYRDEKYVEALEDEIKELKLRLSRQGQGSRGERGRRGQGSSAVAAEEAYRRARTEIAAEAGVGYGRVSLEALYLLPAEFTNVYQRLFLRALKESPGKVGEANPPVKTKGPKARGKETKVVDLYEQDTEGGGHRRIGRGEVTLAGDRDPNRGGGAARAGGRRHRDHWTISDERAFRLKKIADDQLKELAYWISDALARSGAPENGVVVDSSASNHPVHPTSRAADENGRLQPHEANRSTGNLVNQSPQCPSCHRFTKGAWNYCPHCGERIRSTDGDLS